MKTRITGVTAKVQTEHLPSPNLETCHCSSLHSFQSVEISDYEHSSDDDSDGLFLSHQSFCIAQTIKATDTYHS
jgi:hypothetical protein